MIGTWFHPQINIFQQPVLALHSVRANHRPSVRKWATIWPIRKWSPSWPITVYRSVRGVGFDQSQVLIQVVGSDFSKSLLNGELIIQSPFTRQCQTHPIPGLHSVKVSAFFHSTVQYGGFYVWFCLIWPITGLSSTKRCWLGQSQASIRGQRAGLGCKQQCVVLLFIHPSIHTNVPLTSLWSYEM